METMIIVKNEALMVHRYPGAPEEVSYLKDYHRHILTIETEIEVYHENRELEFIMVEDAIKDYLNKTQLTYTDKSCEMVAKEIIEYIIEKYGERKITCKVFEDGENGAKVTRQAHI